MPSDALTRLSLRLRVVLAVRGKTAADIERELGFSQSSISAVINRRKGISIKALDQIAAHLDVDFVTLFEAKHAAVRNRQPARSATAEPLDQVLTDLRALWLQVNDLILTFEAALEAPNALPKPPPRHPRRPSKT